MNIGGLGSSYFNYNTPLNNASSKKSMFEEMRLNNAVETEVQEEGSIIGLTTIDEPNSNHAWGMVAKFATDSTKENPIIYVSTNYGGENKAYKIAINDIDPNNASELEMFALCSYADKTGSGLKSSMGTYSTLLGFKAMSVNNGYFNKKTEGQRTWEEFANVKLDWESACRKVTDLLYKCGDLGQYKNGTHILDLLTKYSGKEFHK